MLTQLARRVFGLGISVFATLGFLAVPLGDKTGFQHAKAIASSSEAQSFVGELREAASELKSWVLEEMRQPSRTEAPATPPELLQCSPRREGPNGTRSSLSSGPP